MSNRPLFRKYGLGIVLTIFSLVTIFGSVAFVQPAKAQFAVTTVTDLPRMLGDLGTKIKEGLKGAVMGAVQKSVSYFMRKVAYDSAVWLASGGKGQSPFANTSGFGDYMENVAGDAFGEAVAALGEPFGLDLCKVPDVKVDLAIKLGLRIRAGEPIKSTNCSWENFKKGWGTEAWKSKYGSVDALQKQFNVSLKADPDTDLGIYLKSVQKIDNIVTKRTEAAKLERQEGQGFKDFTTLISGSIKTPAQLQKLQAEANAPSTQQAKSEAQINAAFASGMFNILPQTLGLFLDTLASQMVKNYQENGMFPFGVCVGEYGGAHCKTLKNSVAVYEGEGAQSGGRAAAQAIFNDFLVASVKTVDNYNILGQLQNCPEEAPSTYNCRIDGDMVSAIQEAGYSNKPITIAEAIEKGWIHKEWKLLSPERPENLDLKCKDTAYCYANIKVLRQVRILPLGFEIAALNSPPDSPWTVKQVVDGFNDCRFDNNGNVVYDPVNHPFCHLIDPSWVLKVEPMRCNAYTYGARLMMSDAPNRLEDCVDLSSCISYNSDGTCSGYGYCTREKNVWRFDADRCDAQYNTCRAFTDSSGKDVAYLYRTLDTSFCSEQTAGCAAFSLNQDPNNSWLEPAVNLNSQYFNNGIHFNSKISTSCGSSSQGCSAFKVSETKDVLYLRKAPDYLNCYDADLATNGIQWPKNNADLSKLQPKADCSLYSGVCTAQEVGCNLFTSLLTDEEIPGKFKAAEISNNQVIWNDQCDAKCNGYAAYREMPNNYSNGRNVAYVIPSSGNTCAAADEGCSSFTNMGEVSAGGEKVEYYSYLRPCIKPDANKQKNFYTYEGNKNGGYQLKSYTLEKTANGSPKYWYKVAGDLIDYNIKCNETAYKAGLSDPDCRQFNDDSGNVYYALLSKTIVVNNSCAYYRLNSSELAAPNTCFQNGEFKDGFCYYYGLPQDVATTAGSSRSCNASAESCFAYKGNTANNVKEVFRDDFENVNQAVSFLGWSAGDYSVESTHYGEHSLLYSGNNPLSRVLNNVMVGRSYVLTFWAKGSATGVNISLYAGNPRGVGSFSTSDVWQYYSFSPVELSGNTTTASLLFSGINGKEIFLDNVRLVEVTDYLYLVRNSLKVDPVCDSNLNDNLPGEALGCAGYSVKGATDTYYLTNFSYLCREGAIGCTAVLDTYNTLENEKPDAYNVWIKGAAGTRSITMTDGKSFSCVILTGESGCYTNVSGYTKSQIETAGGEFNTSTIYIPGDTPVDSPIYLVATAANACNAIDLGCTFAGVKSATASGVKYSTVTIKNDPAEYKNNLCQSQAVGCNAYVYNTGNYYFKDPATTGQKVCSYKSGVNVGGTLTNGWFWKNVGSCSNNTNLNCSSDSDCGSGKCDNIGSTPCYPEYLQSGNNYGLWSFGDKGKYNNFVGECPAEQSGCTEFVDNNDKDTAGNGRPYYFINNNKITAGDCDGLASQKAGCVLFDQTDKPGKMWNTAATYQLSEKNNSQKVSPVVDGKKDANLIVKVARDRECGEWIGCANSHRVWDEKESKFKERCDWIGRCAKQNDYSLASNTTACSNPLSKSNYEYSGQLFNESLYITRKTDWNSMDFTGYSMLGVYPIEELSQVDIDEKNDSADWRLVKSVYCRRNDVNGNCGGSSSDTSCIKEGASCGTPKVGICKNSVCVQDPTGSTNFGDKYLGVSAPQCRAYPESTSPFPNTYKTTQSRNFLGANWCSEIFPPKDDLSKTPNAFSCECEYTKVSYGDYKTLYFNYYKPNQAGAINSANGEKPNPTGVLSGLCQGGALEGRACVSDEECGDRGACQQKTKEDTILGWRGYCLEKDISRNLFADNAIGNCLTWLPIDSLVGLPDINNQRTEAGFQFVNGNGGKYYCLTGSEAKVYGPNYFTIGTPERPQDVCVKEVNVYNEEIDTGLSENCTDAERTLAGYKSDFYTVFPGGIGYTEQVLKLADISNDQQSRYVTIWDIPNNQNDNFNVASVDYLSLHKLEDLAQGENFSQKLYATPKNWFTNILNDQNIIVRKGAITKYTKENISITVGSSPQVDITAEDVDTPSELANAYLKDGEQVLQNVGNSDDVVYVTDASDGLLDENGNGYWYVYFYRGKTDLATYRDSFVTRQGNSLTPVYDLFKTTDRFSAPTNRALVWRSWEECFGNNCAPQNLYYSADSPHCEEGKNIGSTCLFPSVNGLYTCAIRIRFKNFFLFGAQMSCYNGGNGGESKTPNFNFETHTKSVCTNVARTGEAPKDTVADTNILWVKNESKYEKLFTDKDSQRVKYSTFFIPFGSLNIADISKLVSLNDGTTPGVSKDIVYDDDVASAEGKLNNLFAKFNIFQSNNEGYNPPRVFNKTRGADASMAPQVRPLGQCDSSGKCFEAEEIGLTVNGGTKDVNDRDVVLNGENGYFATLKFFAFANASHMPIKRLRIDWGDGVVPYDSSPDSFFRNQRGAIIGTINGREVLVDQCSENEDMAVDFGHITNKTCNNGYFRFTHSYSCTRGGIGWDPGCGGNQAMAVENKGGCCVFRPRVQVKDNWGWCNGNNGSGYYDGNDNPTSANKCGADLSQLSDEAYTEFRGQILVAPQD